MGDIRGKVSQFYLLRIRDKELAIQISIKYSFHLQRARHSTRGLGPENSKVLV